jgi:hypothetical protein
VGKDKKRTASPPVQLLAEINISLAALTWRRGPSVKHSPAQQFRLKQLKPSIVIEAEVAGQH